MRSRLEARWAAFFDICGWRWDYEPLDLNGYIPDFVLHFYRPIIVEVKPVMEYAEFSRYTGKIQNSGWTNEALLVGARMFSGEDWFSNSAALGCLLDKDIAGDGWSEAIVQRCTECRQVSFISGEVGWECRVCGAYDGNHFVDVEQFDTVQERWNEAGSMTQYRH